eukprot:jgi/Orpsp1_1/1190313/evm.model.d7180000078197.1
MKFYASLFLFCTLFLTQIFSASALPINGNSTLEKRKIRPVRHLNSFIYFRKPDNWGENVNAYIYKNGEVKDNWPGFSMAFNEKENFYHLAIENQVFFDKEDLRVIFNDGEKSHQAPGVMQEGFVLTMDGVYDENGIIGITNEKPNGIYFNGADKLYYTKDRIRILYRPKENFFEGHDIYAHYKIGNGNWNDIPGDKLKGYWSGFSYINIDLYEADEVTIVFTDGKKWDNNNGKDYKFKKYVNNIIDNNN